jgi:hypothetical protein
LPYANPSQDINDASPIVDDLFPGLKYNDTLTYLNIGGNEFYAREAGEILASTLKDNRTLWVVRICDCKDGLQILPGANSDFQSGYEEHSNEVTARVAFNKRS